MMLVFLSIVDRTITLLFLQVKCNRSVHYMKISQYIFQEDLLTRKRQLATMDLFLESAREQLKLLMSDSETMDDS